MAKNCILITRPAAVSQPLCDGCRDLGLAVLHHPITEIITSRESIDLPATAAVVFTSQNAITTQIRQTLSNNMQIFAVGEQTARILTQTGCENIVVANGNANDLLEKLKTLPKSKSIIHLCGDMLRVNIAAELKQLGYNAKSLEVYQTKINTNFPNYITNALKEQRVSILPLFSPRTAKLLMDYFDFNAIETNNITTICLSQAVADVLANKRWKNIIIQPKITTELIYDISIGRRLYA